MGSDAGTNCCCGLTAPNLPGGCLRWIRLPRASCSWRRPACCLPSAALVPTLRRLALWVLLSGFRLVLSFYGVLWFSGHLWVFVRAFFDLQDSRRSNLHSCIRFKRLLHARNMTNVLSPQVTACAPGTQAGGLEPSASHHLRARYAGGRTRVRTHIPPARQVRRRESWRLSARFIVALQRA